MASQYIFCLYPAYIYTGVAGLVAAYFFRKYYIKYAENKKYEKFQDTPKDVVVLHMFPKQNFPSNIPTPQPWVQKIELYCKLAKIPYIVESEVPFGPNGKSPWITLNGLHKSDSQLIIEFLEKKFNVRNLNGSYSSGELAVARAVRVMLEERFFWSMPLWRFIWDDGKELFYRDWTCIKLPFFLHLWYFRRSMGKLLGDQTIGHGVGRHTKPEIMSMMEGDLRTVSAILGSKKFILGETICVEDCAIFGQVAQVVYGMPESPWEKLVKEELPNLFEYCDRIKREYFPEWKEKKDE